MGRLFQIHDDDLSDLERTVPAIAERLISVMDNGLRVKIRRVQKILSDVRWGYGPPEQIEKIPAGDDGLDAI